MPSRVSTVHFQRKILQKSSHMASSSHATQPSAAPAAKKEWLPPFFAGSSGCSSSMTSTDRPAGGWADGLAGGQLLCIPRAGARPCPSPLYSVFSATSPTTTATTSDGSPSLRPLSRSPLCLLASTRRTLSPAQPTENLAAAPPPPPTSSPAPRAIW